MIELILILLPTFIGTAGGAAILRGSSVLGVKAISYHIQYKKCKKLIKKGIYDRDYKTLEVIEHAVEGFVDIKYQTNKVNKIFHMYNIDDNIIDDENDFNKFYQISMYDKLTDDVIQQIVNRYAEERELSIIAPDRFYEAIQRMSSDSDEENTTENEENVEYSITNFVLESD